MRKEDQKCTISAALNQRQHVNYSFDVDILPTVVLLLIVPCIHSPETLISRIKANEEAAKQETLGWHSPTQ